MIRDFVDRRQHFQLILDGKIFSNYLNVIIFSHLPRFLSIFPQKLQLAQIETLIILSKLTKHLTIGACVDVRSTKYVNFSTSLVSFISFDVDEFPRNCKFVNKVVTKYWLDFLEVIFTTLLNRIFIPRMIPNKSALESQFFT